MLPNKPLLKRGSAVSSETRTGSERVRSSSDGAA
jgi:hypothetical protein